MQQKSSSKQVCVCDICKCGDHKCPQQFENTLSEKLPISCDLNKPISYEDSKKTVHQVHDQPLKINLYSTSTYKEDFKIKPNTAPGPPETAKRIANLKCGPGTMETDSAYSRDYVPWSLEQMRLLQTNTEPVETLESIPVGMKEQFDALDLKPEVVRRLRGYYCPPHCSGNDEKPKINSSTAYKEKFNLGPPSKKTMPPTIKSSQPFSKFTNYNLDYIPHKIELRTRPAAQTLNDTITNHNNLKPPDTTHKSDYTCWHRDDYIQKQKDLRPKDDELGQKSTLKLETDKPMVPYSMNTMDYRYHGPVAPPTGRQGSSEFRVPNCRMETETTAKLAFQPWEHVPMQIRKKQLEKSDLSSSKDTRCFVTNYQQDFDDLKKVKCPAKAIEKYGRKVLEPKYCYVGTENRHEYYKFKEEIA